MGFIDRDANRMGDDILLAIHSGSKISLEHVLRHVVQAGIVGTILITSGTHQLSITRQRRDFVVNRVVPDRDPVGH